MRLLLVLLFNYLVVTVDIFELNMYIILQAFFCSFLSELVIASR